MPTSKGRKLERTAFFSELRDKNRAKAIPATADREPPRMEGRNEMPPSQSSHRGRVPQHNLRIRRAAVMLSDQRDHLPRLRSVQSDHLIRLLVALRNPLPKAFRASPILC